MQYNLNVNDLLLLKETSVVDGQQLLKTNTMYDIDCVFIYFTRKIRFQDSYSLIINWISGILHTWISIHDATCILSSKKF